jgi:hypothetical protein
MEARRGPQRGEFEAYLRVPESMATETPGSLTARLVLADGTILQDSKPCVVEPHPPSRERGKALERRSNYKIIDVWKQPPADRPGAKTWDDLDWDETHVGKYELVPDPADEDKELLLLYVSMDNQELSKEKQRCLRRLGELATRRLETRYKAYIGYHLWLHFERNRLMPTAQASTSNDENSEVYVEDAKKEENLYEEMRRVAQTVLLAMRSERDLMAALQEETA